MGCSLVQDRGGGEIDGLGLPGGGLKNVPPLLNFRMLLPGIAIMGSFFLARDHTRLTPHIIQHKRLEREKAYSGARVVSSIDNYICIAMPTFCMLVDLFGRQVI